MYEEAVLDSHHQSRACEELGITPKTEEYTGNDPLEFVIEKDYNRRNLDESQRAMVAARIANLKHGQKKADAQICASGNVPKGYSEKENKKLIRAHITPLPKSATQNEAADKFNVSRRTVQSARKVIEGGVAPLVAAVDWGITPEKRENTLCARHISLKGSNRPV